MSAELCFPRIRSSTIGFDRFRWRVACDNGDIVTQDFRIFYFSLVIKLSKFDFILAVTCRDDVKILLLFLEKILNDEHTCSIHREVLSILILKILKILEKIGKKLMKIFKSLQGFEDQWTKCTNIHDSNILLILENLLFRILRPTFATCDPHFAYLQSISCNACIICLLITTPLSDEPQPNTTYLYVYHIMHGPYRLPYCLARLVFEIRYFTWSCISNYAVKRTSIMHL